MDNFKLALDRHLTAEPYNDGYEEWCELVAEHYSEHFIERHDVDFDVCCDWEDKLFDKGYWPADAAKVVMRAAGRYFKCLL